MEQFTDIDEVTKVRAITAYLKQRRRVYDYKKKHPEKNREFARKYYRQKKERLEEENKNSPSVLEQFSQI